MMKHTSWTVAKVLLLVSSWGDAVITVGMLNVASTYSKKVCFAVLKHAVTQHADYNNVIESGETLSRL